MQRTQRVIRTRDPSEAAVVVARTHVTQEVAAAADGDPFVFEERTRGTRLLSLESTRCTGVLTGRVEPDSAMTLVWLKSGRGDIDGRAVPIGRPVLYRQEPQQFRWESFQKDVIRIDRRVVEEVAAERGDWAPGPLEFRPRHVPEGAPLAAWWLMIRTVASEVLRGPVDVPAERERELTRFAAGGLLTAIPHWPVGQRAPETAASARFRRAETFVLDHTTEPIRVEDIAGAADMSVRGLQESFQRNHGMPPMTYLRRIRLQLARQELEAGASATIGEIAQAAGFRHLGRFADAYRNEFGELPRETWAASRDSGSRSSA